VGIAVFIDPKSTKSAINRNDPKSMPAACTNQYHENCSKECPERIDMNHE
jgi:hypothetical protein